MGQFESGHWIVVLLLYFTLFFTVVYCVVAGMTENNANDGISYNDPGYGATPTNDHTIGIINATGEQVSSSNAGMSDVLTSISVITNIGSGSYQLGIDSNWTWLFSFFFFYIPFFMLLWAIYMALPIIH